MISRLVEKPKITQVFERADIFEINYYSYLIIYYMGGFNS